MQVSQGDISSNRAGAEDSINFRPSPNFKNMKKFFKLKLDYEENEMKNGNTVTIEPLPPPNLEKYESKKEVQPPLPLDPPPNDNIEHKNTLKTLISVDHGNFKEEKPTNTDLNKGKPKQSPKETICRDFLRGNCIRIGCKFAHKNDVSHEDLYGVYTFCHEYQSQACTRALCRYVHATVFEEQEYYRTGNLPPHAFAHMINNNNNNKNLLMPPPPPPPPKTQAPSRPKKETVNFNVPPPPLHNDGPAANCVTSNAMKVIPSAIPPITSLAPLVQPAPKRDWSLMEFSSPGRGMDVDIQAPKKCKQCNNNEFRYQYNKDKLENIKQAKEEIHKKIAILDKNSEKLNTFIQALLIRSLSKSPNLHCLKDKLSEMVGALSTMQNDGQV